MPFQRGGGGLPDLSPPSPLPLILLEGMSHDKFLKALWRVLQLLIFPFFFFLQRRVCKAAERNHGFAVDKHLYARSEGGVCSVHAIFACYQVRWLQLLVMISYMNCGAASLGCITRQLCCINWVDNVNWVPRKDGSANISSRVSASSRQSIFAIQSYFFLFLLLFIAFLQHFVIKAKIIQSEKLEG